MSKLKHSEEHEQLARQLAEDVYSIVVAELPRISANIEEEGRQATIPLPVTFKHHKGGETKPSRITYKLKPKVDMPLPTIEREIEYRNGQLALFDIQKVERPPRGKAGNGSTQAAQR